MPAPVTALACGSSIENDEVNPLVLEELAHSRLRGEDGIDKFRFALDDYREAAGFVDEVLAIVDGLEWESAAEIACVSFDDSESADHLVNGLVASGE